MTKIWEWFADKPKLKIFWEHDTIGDWILPNGEVRAHIMLLVDVVNVRMRPVTIRSWNLEIKTAQGKTYKANKEIISPGFRLTMADGKAHPADFSKSVLYQKTFDDPLVYGKTVRGWLRFSIPQATRMDLESDLTYVFVAHDAFGKIHKLKCSRKYAQKDIGLYYHGAGM